MEKAVSPPPKVMSATQGRQVALHDAERELRRAWMAADDEVRRARGEGMLRLRETNLVIYATAEADAARARAAAARLMRVHPGRVVLLTPQAQAASGGDPEAFISTACFQDEESGRQICSEEVVIRGTEETRALQAVVLQLLVPDLPVVTWWLGDLETSWLDLSWLAEASDQLIVDVDSSADAAQGLQTLDEMLRRHRGSARPFFRELNWLRTAPWRKLIAELFESPERRRLLADIDRLVVEHDSAFSQALLFAAWFGGRLGFARIEGDWQRDDAGWHVRLKAAPAGAPVPARSLVLELRRVAKGAEATPGLVGASVHTSQPSPAEDVAEGQVLYLRRRPHSYSCIACVAGSLAESTVKALELPQDEDWALLSAVLESPAPDRVFEEALGVAADLASLPGIAGPRGDPGP